MPLIRCNFHVTESGVHRYRIFFFRQDVWRNLAEPAMASLKHAMFEEVDINVAKSVLDSRTIGFSQIRLLPKEKGVRPILNLRRRQVRRDSKRALGPSINATLAPVYNMLTFEKVYTNILFLADANTGRTYHPRSLALLFSLSAICTIKSRSLRKQSNLRTILCTFAKLMCKRRLTQYLRQLSLSSYLACQRAMNIKSPSTSR